MGSLLLAPLLAGLIAPAVDASRFDEVLNDAKLQGAIASAIVTDMDGKVLYEHNSAIHVMPASNMKLLSNTFALYQLGSDWHPVTRIWKEANGVFVDSTGDPMLTHEQLVQARKKLGLDGRQTVFVREEYAPLWGSNWEYGDLPNKYAAPVAAFTVDRGSFEVWASRGRGEFLPEAYGSRLVESKVLPEGTTLAYDPFKRTVFYRAGAFAKDGRLDTLSLPNPDEAAALILGRKMVRVETVPTRPADLEIRGASTIEIVGACLPPSDNQLAEQLLLLGARRQGGLGNDPYSQAQKRLTNFLVRIVGVNADDIRVDDGSGLSRHNFVTTRAIAKLLAWQGQQPTADSFRAAMAHAGKGTLATRLKGITFDGKTGSLDMVAALSGYVETPDHQTRIVSVILNGFGCTGTEARNVLDRFVALCAGA